MTFGVVIGIRVYYFDFYSQALNYAKENYGLVIDSDGIVLQDFEI